MRSNISQIANKLEQYDAQSYAHLGTDFAVEVKTTPLLNSKLVHFNQSLSDQIEFDSNEFLDQEFQEKFQKDLAFEGVPTFSTVYSGHQFGVWAGQLGDGRAHLLAEWLHKNERWDLQFKGSGHTPFSRMGDGRAVFRSSLREYLASEYMYQIGVPTSRALAIYSSEEPVYRELTENGALVLRAGKCFVRIGNFEHFFAKEDFESLQQLLDYSIKRWYPDLVDVENKVREFLISVAQKTAVLMARWQVFGFCHGVMNSDNMAINGDTIDYGPYGFMDDFNYHHICNHSDQQGRYKYSDQPGVALWNLMRLHESLSPLMKDSDDIDVAEFKDSFVKRYHKESNRLWQKKLGLKIEAKEQQDFLGETLKMLHENQVDWTGFWYELSQLEQGDSFDWSKFRVAQIKGDAWFEKYLYFRGSEQWEFTQKEMAEVSPAFTLRNYLVQRLINLEGQSEFDAKMEELWEVLQNPFEKLAGKEEWYRAPTFAEKGKIPSCSS